MPIHTEERDTADFLRLGLAELGSRLPKGRTLADAPGLVPEAEGTALPRPDFERLSNLWRSLEPRAATEFRPHSHLDPIPAQAPEPAGLTERDFENLDRVFEEVLPGHFAEEAGSEDASAFSRPAQREMARRVGRTLGSDRFLLLDAPTGTGKTLAYLVPALLWAVRSGARVGVSTYTRTLQEQALDRELPRALRALRAVGVGSEIRATLLKGRSNYMCWKRLGSLLPGVEEGAEEFLAWLLLARFALIDPTGDLDRFQPELPAGFFKARRVQDLLQRLRREAAAGPSCCRAGEGRRLCAADIARRRAERAHLIITNHAFVFASPEFFHHVIFDEAEHLHAQALSSGSLEFRPYALERRLEELCQDRSGSRSPLDLLRRGGSLLAAEWGPRVPQAVEAWQHARSALEVLRETLLAFERWRRAEVPRRDPRTVHSLLRSFVSGPEGEEVRAAARALSRRGEELLRSLDGLLEDLVTAPLRGGERMRGQIARIQAEIAETLGEFRLVLPCEEGEARFDAEFFYDLERETAGRREILLVRRVLLPDAWLAKRFWPGLRSAALLSATAHLHGGFEATEAYLGLDRIPGREGGSAVNTFKAPDPFDYSRVLFAVPSDAPRFDAGREGREVFLRYVRDFLDRLCRRTRGRCLALFTSAEDLANVAEALEPAFHGERIPFWYQGMEGIPKEQLAPRFRDHPGSVLFGLDTFWHGVDFPGGICEFVVLVKLPYGQLDRYHFAQREALGESEHRKRIYLPRALAMFRQGFGRLMRKKDDRGAVFLLDRRSLEPRHRHFFQELPGRAEVEDEEPRLKTLFAPTARCLEAAFQHLQSFSGERGSSPAWEGGN